MMEYEVLFSLRAEQDLDDIIQFLSANYVNRVKIDFLAKLSDCLRLLSQMPFINPASEQNPAVRRCVINKFVSIYYIVRAKEVYLVRLKDNRTNPADLDL